VLSLDDLELAIEWLRLNEGEAGEAEACSRAADFLERELKRRERDAVARSYAKEKGLDPAFVKKALRRANAA
jgi:hypothetical protein